MRHRQINDESKQILDLYLREISRIPLLDPKEEIELARRAKRGDLEARDKLARSNTRFVVSFAKRYQWTGIPLIDLIQEGNMGLMRAVKKFDPDKGVKFISYAVWWIRQSIMAAMARHGINGIKLPLNVASLPSKIKAIREVSGRFSSKSLDNEEIARVVDESPETIDALTGVMDLRMIKLDVSASDDGDEALHERVKSNTPLPDENISEMQDREQVMRHLEVLSPRERRIIVAYYGLEGNREMTLEALGVMLGVTRERIRQLRDKALLRLKLSIEGKRKESPLTLDPNNGVQNRKVMHFIEYLAKVCSESVPGLSAQNVIGTKYLSGSIPARKFAIYFMSRRFNLTNMQIRNFFLQYKGANISYNTLAKAISSVERVYCLGNSNPERQCEFRRLEKYFVT